jgi:subtilisin family serine protease
MKNSSSQLLVLACVMVLYVICATTFTGASQDTHAQKSRSKPESDERFVSGRMLVKFHDGIQIDHARNIIAALGTRDVEEIAHLGVHVLELPSRADEKLFIKAFRSQPEVEFAELDRLVEPADVIPNDPWYAGGEWHLPKISAPTAWSSTTGSSSVVVAILDTGVDASHPDLVGNLIAGWNVYNNNADTADVHGHGTNVAGTVAARTNNALGVASLCWNCRLMPIRISDASGYATYSDTATGLTWAADHGAKIANISYIVSDSSTVATAAKYFQGKGGVVTVSAGNYSTFDSANDNPYMLTVSATDINDLHSDFSNYGNNIDLSAPEGVYTTARGGGYAYAGGTSFSAPIVAGVAALVWSVNPSLTPTQVQNIVKESADDLGAPGWDIYFGSGRVNAARAVAMAGGAPSPSPSPTASPSPSPTPSPDTTPPTVAIISPINGATVSGNASVYVNASDNVAVTRVELYVDGKLNVSSTTAPFTLKWNTRKATAGMHVLQCRAYDAAGNTGTSAQVSAYK